MGSINKQTSLEEKKTVLHDKGLTKKLRICTLAVGSALACVLIALSVININQVVENSKKGYSIMVNDYPVAIVANAEDAQKAVEGYISEQNKAVEQEVYVSQRLDITEDKLTEEQTEFQTVDEAKALLAARVTPIVNASAIMVNGKKQVTVGSKEVADSVLERVKNHYVPNDSTLEVLDVKFRNKVEVASAWASVKEVETADEAANYLVNGTNDTIATHKIVEGENAWAIAIHYGVSTAELAAANPDIDLEKLKIDQKIKLVSSKPMIEVVTVLQKVSVNTIPYKTVYATDRSAPAGSQTVAQKGQNGKEEVTLQLVRVNGNEVNRSRLNTVVLEAAVDKKVTKGAAVTVASRSGGSGELLWPTSAKRISSYYGSRSRGFHTGIDIDGNYGNSVWAADSGTVTFTGWSGGYGYCVLISHGNGMVTRYAHLSSISVSTGSSVSAGQTVGRMGSSGNSTGSHLHFEVIVNGCTRNPLGYL